ncbi:hypothetical protein [Sinorhizobium meliloti]|uniref:hypothetical protein n=1 Tax=Rhizobium meliloti TaxID=382 RepID=UPI001F268033|nr:hypothetical protein [Sinorhizobium meliloti]
MTNGTCGARPPKALRHLTVGGGRSKWHKLRQGTPDLAIELAATSRRKRQIEYAALARHIGQDFLCDGVSTPGPSPRDRKSPPFSFLDAVFRLSDVDTHDGPDCISGNHSDYFADGSGNTDRYEISVF